MSRKAIQLGSCRRPSPALIALLVDCNGGFIETIRVQTPTEWRKVDFSYYHINCYSPLDSFARNTPSSVFHEIQG